MRSHKNVRRAGPVGRAGLEARLLRLYPRGWREKYGEEFLALLEQTDVSGRQVSDVVVAASRERILAALGMLSWVPKLVGYFGLALAVLFAISWMRNDMWLDPMHIGFGNLFVAFSFVYLSIHVFSQLWLVWRPSTVPRSIPEKLSAQGFVMVACITACVVASRMSMSLYAVFGSHSSLLSCFVTIAGAIVPDEISLRSKPRAISRLLVRTSQPGSFLGLGPGAAA